MPQAKITVNGVVGSNVTLPINTSVSLDNQNIGGELSYTWTILDQPPGTADALSSTVLQNPTFTPKKEGTYLIRLIVNQGLATEQEDRVVCGIRQLKTLERIPAAGETTEADTSDGWATANNSMLRRMDGLISDPGQIVGVNASGGNLARGTVVRCSAASVIKSGLPGQETVPGFSTATAATLDEIDELLCVVEGGVVAYGASPTTPVANGALIVTRYIGRLAQVSIANGPVAIGDTIYVNDAGALDAVQGTIRRRVGSAMSAGSTADVWFNGVGGADVDLTPIDRRYVVYGDPGTLPNGFRVDGTTNASSVSGGDAFAIKTGDNATVTTILRRFSGAGAALQQWQDEAGAALAQVLNSGRVELSNGLSAPLGTLATFLHTNHVATFQSSSGSYTELTLANVSWTGRLRASNAGPFLLETVGAVNIDVAPNSTTAWRFASGGQLQGQGGNRAIQNVLDPVGAQDAATKASQDAGDASTLLAAQRADTFGVFNNILINSGFDFIQRGTTRTVTDVTARVQGPDRWALYATKTGGTGNTQLTSSRVANALVGGQAPYAGRFTLDAVPTADWSIAIVQEIDRDFVVQARGKKLALRMLLGDGSVGWSGDVRVEIITGTGAVTQNVSTPYTGAATLYTADLWVASLSTLSTLTASAVPANATTMALRIYSDQTLAAGAAATDDFDITDIMLVPVDSNLTALPGWWPSWRRAGGGYGQELIHCQRYFEKSYDVDTAPGSTSAEGFVVAPAVSLGGSVQVQTVQYKVTKWNGAITVTGYLPDTASTTGWRDVTAGANRTVSLTGGTNTIRGTITSGVAGNVMYGHWTADAEI